MLRTLLRRLARWLLVIVTAFQALSAIGGGIGILATGGLGMPETMLASGPFDSFTGPGLILLVVVGGTQAVAAALVLARREGSLMWSAIAGFGMIIWIFTETGLIAGISWLQILYFATGTAQLALVFALLGLIRMLPREPLRANALGPSGGGR